MANKNLFRTLMGKMVPATNTVNEAMAPAYAFNPEHALAQYAASGCLSSTFYASAEVQLERVLAMCKEIDAEFIARVAVFARERGAMKDMPALLCAYLSTRDARLLERVFFRVVDNGRMLRTFVQIMRSGEVGRKSLGTAPKRLVRQWLERHSDDVLFRASVGASPSLSDIIRMVHPKPNGAEREAVYGYLLGRPVERARLSELVQAYEEFKEDRNRAVPDVPFEMLTALPLTTKQWTRIAWTAPWQMTRMNLNTFARHRVFDETEQTELADRIADRLKDPAAIRKARAFPFQLLVAYRRACARVPAKIRAALEDAMELATQNVPRIDGKVFVFPDVSGSMTAPVTGYRGTASSSVRCVDAAALVSATLLRVNPDTTVMPFEHELVSVSLSAKDSIMTNAAKLASIGGGGTNCSAPLLQLNRKGAKGDVVIYVSDNQSWVDAGGPVGTATAREWSVFKKRNPKARMICIDLQPYANTQAAESQDILNIGGFSDQVFDVISAFTDGKMAGDHWINLIRRVEL